MYRVLLAVDDHEDDARRAAESVAALPGDPAELAVLILNVFERRDVSDGRVHGAEPEFDETAFPASVAAASEVLEAAGIDPSRRRERGAAATTIVDVAGEIDADAIGMSGRKQSPSGKVLFGSVTQSVLRAADRPVLVTMTG
jgi:nucleotide-binding universal stress UspA family protein